VCVAELLALLDNALRTQRGPYSRRMGTLKQWIGQDSVDGGREVRFGSRAITITDLVDVQDALTTIFDSSTIHRLTYDGLGEEIPDLYNAPDSDLRRVEVIGWAGDHDQALKLQVGAHADSWLSVNDGAVTNPEVLTMAKGKITDMIIRSGHRTLSRDNQIALLRLGTLLVTLALVGWLAIVVWPNVPAILVGLMAAVAFQSILGGPLQRIVGRNFRSGQNHHILVQYISRQEQRERRSRRLFGLATFLAGAAVTALVTVVATYGGEWLARR
jgi:hypothetical protein